MFATSHSGARRGANGLGVQNAIWAGGLQPVPNATSAADHEPGRFIAAAATWMLWSIRVGIAMPLRNRMRRRAALHRLMSLSDDRLKDIGLARGNIPAAVEGSYRQHDPGARRAAPHATPPRRAIETRRVSTRRAWTPSGHPSCKSPVAVRATDGRDGGPHNREETRHAA